jgi:PAS domain-containing protein
MPPPTDATDAATMPGSRALYLAQLLRANLLMALALFICLATILWCIFLTRRQRNGLDKMLTGLLGLIAVYESFRILKDSGFVAFARFRRIEGWVDLISACLYLLAALILKTSSTDRAATKVHLRLAEADERRVDMGSAVIAAWLELGHPLVDSSPLAIFAIDPHGIVTYWNVAAESLFGWTRNELVGRELPFDPNGPIQRKNGSFIEAAVWTSPIRSSNGQTAGTMIIAAGEIALQAAGLEFSASSRTRHRGPQLTVRG